MVRSLDCVQNEKPTLKIL